MLHLIKNQLIAHGAMQFPPTWFDQGGASALKPGGFDLGVMWFSNETGIPDGQKHTLPDFMRTYKSSGGYPGSGGFKGQTPWLAPGTAEIFSPCGIRGGNPHGCPIGEGKPGDTCPGGGTAYGQDAIKLYEAGNFSGAVTTTWEAGGTAEVAWGIQANHGGGYSYRLCKASEGLTEACFQRGALAFVGDTQHAQWGADPAARVSWRANRTTINGTTWTKNPIPACGGVGGGYLQPSGLTCGRRLGTQFPPPANNLTGGVPLQARAPARDETCSSAQWPARLPHAMSTVDGPLPAQGFCESKGTGWRPDCSFAIYDTVRVPAELAPGDDYVLSFRWDCEQTPQVWTTCSSIRVTAPAVVEAA